MHINKKKKYLAIKLKHNYWMLFKTKNIKIEDGYFIADDGMGGVCKEGYVSLNCDIKKIKEKKYLNNLESFDELYDKDDPEKSIFGKIFKICNKDKEK